MSRKGIRRVLEGLAAVALGTLVLLGLATHLGSAQVQRPVLVILLDGSWVRSVDASVGRDSPWRRIAERLWGQLRFSITGEVTAEVVVGRDGWLFTVEELEVSADPGVVFNRVIARVAVARDQLLAARGS